MFAIAAGLKETERNILRKLQERPLSMVDLGIKLGYRTITGNVRKALHRLHGLGLVALTIPEKPQSKKQKRRLTEQGIKILASLDAPGHAEGRPGPADRKWLSP